MIDPQSVGTYVMETDREATIMSKDAVQGILLSLFCFVEVHELLHQLINVSKFYCVKGGT